MGPQQRSFLVRGVSTDSRDHGEGKYILSPNSWERRKADVQGRKSGGWTEDQRAGRLNRGSSFLLTRVLEIANQFRHGLTMVSFPHTHTLNMWKLKQTSSQSWSNVCPSIGFSEERGKTSMPRHPRFAPTSPVPPRVDFLGFPL